MIHPSVWLSAYVNAGERLEIHAYVNPGCDPSAVSGPRATFDVIDVNGMGMYLSRAQTIQLHAALTALIALPKPSGGGVEVQ